MGFSTIIGDVGEIGNGGAPITDTDSQSIRKAYKKALTLLDISGGLSLPETPDSPNVTYAELTNGQPLEYGTDFTVAGNLLTFSPAIQALLEAGDVLLVRYNKTTTIV